MWSDRVLHGWITAINPDFRSFSPGYLLMQWVMQKSAEEGVELSDLGPGQLDYKKFYTNEFAPLGTYTGKIPGKLRPLGDLWVGAERFAPDRLSRIMTKIRRRSDQICASEPVWQERLAGHANALLKNRP
ncbi:MAG: GNAT family N-acetyltransferase [Pseudomonadota bacterium]